jgi:uncharacterized protein (TIGR02246 family)
LGISFYYWEKESVLKGIGLQTRRTAVIFRIALSFIVGTIMVASGVSAETSGMSPDDAAIRKAVDSYVEAFNRGDASAAASHWGREGSYVSEKGEQAKGPEKIRPALEKFFSENKGIQVKVSLFDVQIQSKDKAVAKGFAVFRKTGEEDDEAIFTADYAKEAGSWRLISVKEEDPAVPLATIAKLGELEWLIGDWVDQDEHASVETSFRWAKDYAYIVGTFRVTVEDRIDLEGTQVIGWDPAGKKLRSWIFDSRAGFGEGEWSRAGNSWTINVKSILGTGQKASSMNIYRFVDHNSFKWQSVSREVAGELLPDIDEVTVVRKSTQSTQAQSGK